MYSLCELQIPNELEERFGDQGVEQCLISTRYLHRYKGYDRYRSGRWWVATDDGLDLVLLQFQGLMEANGDVVHEQALVL